MNSNLPTLLNPSGNEGMKISNWDKPGGKLGMVVAGLIGAAALLGLYKILPYLIKLATDTISLILLCLLIAGILWLITNKQFRKAVSIGYFMLMRKLTSLFIEIDPIAIIEMRVLDMKKKIKEMTSIMGNLKGLINETQRKTNVEKENLKDEIEKVKIYESQGAASKMKAQMSQNQVYRLNELIKTYEGNLAQSQKWFTILTKLHEMAELTVEDTENEVRIRKEQFETVKQQHSAFKSVMSIIDDDPDELAIFTEAMDFMARDISNKLGEMEFVIDSAGGLMDNYEMGKALSSKKAAEIIKRYDEKGIDGMFENFNGNISQDNDSLKALDYAQNKMLDMGDDASNNQIKSRFFN